MKDDQPVTFRNISDTALWVAIYRARESERSDAHFNDPYARRLAGERGEKLAADMQKGMKHEWPMVARTVNIDQIVLDCIADGADMVINLACGLDTRPYRLDLPPDLKWAEVDLPDMIDYKQQMLAGETPKCKLERVRLDLRSVDKRRKLFIKLNSECTKALVISEGLIVYLDPDEVASLATDLGAQPHFTDWVIDIATPALLKMMQKSFSVLEAANAPLKFAPDDGPDHYRQFGWEPAEIDSALHTAAKLKRLPWFMKLFSLFPDSHGRKPKQVWGGVVRLTRAG